MKQIRRLEAFRPLRISKDGRITDLEGKAIHVIPLGEPTYLLTVFCGEFTDAYLLGIKSIEYRIPIQVYKITGRRNGK